jgi:7-cyano-7-deazaguanine synthase in queuosine biosynthesis
MQTTQSDALEQQVARLGEMIVAEIPGEPSQSEGAVDTAIRLLRQYVACLVNPTRPCGECENCIRRTLNRLAWRAR